MGRCVLPAFILGLFISTTVLFTPALSVAAETTQKTPMIISGHPDYPPFMWREGTTIKGVGVKLLSTICDELNIPYLIKEDGPWERVQRNARAGNIDVIVGIYLNEERLTYLNYSTAYLSDPTCIAVLPKSTLIYTKRSDLIGKVGITMHGDSFGTELDAYIEKKLRVERAHSAEALLKNLYNKRVEYILWGQYALLINAKKNHFSDIKLSTTPIVTENLHIAFSKKSPFTTRLSEFNVIIKRLKAEGRIQKWTDEALHNYQLHLDGVHN